MAKATRRAGIAVASAAALGLIAAPFAMASGAPAFQDDPDNIQDQWSIDNNLDNLFRVAGPDRISTSIKLMESTSKWAYCGWWDSNVADEQAKHQSRERNCDTVIVARADDFADALSAGPLADVYNAPILLTNTGTIDGRVLAAIADHGFRNAILVGGTGIFPESARAQLEGVVGVDDVTRMRGVDRYETATGIAREVAKKVTNNGVNKRNINVYLATGVDFPDALAAGAAAADNDGVVLLTKDRVMEDFTYNFLTKQSDKIRDYANGIEIHTVGGQAEDAAESRIEDIADRNTGADRYKTAVLLSNKFKNPIEKFAVVSGETYADALAGGGFAANHDGALLLTQNATLNADTKARLAQVADTNVDVVVIGGPGAVSRNVSTQLAQELYTW